MGITQIDINLIEAWNRVGRRCREDRAEALRRSRRRFQATMTAPPRAWCLAIRASDRRITPSSACFEFPSWYDLPEDDPTPREQFIGDDETWQAALQRGVAHSVIITGTLVRELTKPVFVPWPGKPQSEVARLLGRETTGIHRWIDRDRAYPYPLATRPGSLASGRPLRWQGRDWKPGLVKGVLKLWGFDYCRMHGRIGLPVPIVYTPSPIDPNHRQGRVPDPVWGTLWQDLWNQMPEAFVQEIHRSPRWRNRKCGRRFIGWDWICPGLRSASGAHEPCGRRSQLLFAPMPIWTLGKSGVMSLALDMPEDSGLAGQWHPGEHDTPVGQGNRTFACSRCWKVSHLQLSDRKGWNRFVSYITGGLLYGHEVERPLDEVPKQRKTPFRRRAGRAAPQRARVIELLVHGLTYAEIARRMGITRSVVSKHVVSAYRQHGVHSRAELIAALQSEPTSPRITAAAAR